MKIIVCIDKNNGMLFNNRRTSRDREVIKDIVNNYSDANIWVKEYSKELFEDYFDDNNLGSLEDNNIVVDEQYLLKIEDKDYCFIEDREIINYTDKVEKVIIYRWNRDYPADVYYEFDNNQFSLEETSEIKGYSHDIITKEIYVRKSV